MPFIIAAIGAIAAAYFFVVRARNTADMASELIDLAKEVPLAARRFGFRRRANQHPVEGVDDARVAVAAIAAAFLELDSLPTQDMRQRFHLQLRSQMRISDEDATELAVLARWLVEQCNGAKTAIPRLARRLFKIDGSNSFEQLLTIISKSVGDGGLNDNQRSALDDIRRAFRIT
ncbi:hypothetical protein [Marivivens marinus]|uniref:hypothetical protein n=1 Tax=Marivivens marinus TaxID=3110173 RepID=UPI003B8493B3